MRLLIGISHLTFSRENKAKVKRNLVALASYNDCKQASVGNISAK